MVLVRWIQLPDQDTRGVWVEINSQILNACFTLSALCVAPSRMLNLWRLCVYMSRTKVGREGTGEPRNVEIADRIERTYAPLLLRPDDRKLADDPATYAAALLDVRRRWLPLILLLNGQCLFQWPITVAMWGWATHYQDRPGYIVGAFLPLSFLSGTIGGSWLGYLQGKVAKAKRAAEHDAESGEGASAGAGGDGDATAGVVKPTAATTAAAGQSATTMGAGNSEDGGYDDEGSAIPLTKKAGGLAKKHTTSTLGDDVGVDSVSHPIEPATGPGSGSNGAAPGPSVAANGWMSGM
ncbi:hypothetical protein HK101_009656 [Irineochytrium annulatum]|nr:hypothetical protein HK101_009656 [Irineochytrium annulatum]